MRGVELASGSCGWDSSKALLYAVGIGAGLQDPLDELQFTTENTPERPQQVIPSFLTLLNLPSDWAGLCGWTKEGLSPIGVVHGEQGMTLARPLPTSGTVRLSKMLEGVYDKGSGALLVMDLRATDEATGELIGSTRMKLFAQGKGGFGGPRGPAEDRPWAGPDRKADVIISLPVGLNQSLIYRLSGDRHPHGTYPPRAHADGFERPIFYGLGTFGVACRALLKGLCEGHTETFGDMSARFAKPVYPGDRLDTHIWRTEEGASFQTYANGERLVLDRGVFKFRQGS